MISHSPVSRAGSINHGADDDESQVFLDQITTIITQILIITIIIETYVCPVSISSHLMGNPLSIRALSINLKKL